jgi:CRP-like cAMP-binding protein
MNALALGSDDERAAAAGIFQDCPVAALSAGQVRPPTAFGDARLLVVERGIALVCSLPPEAERRMVLGVVGEGSILAPPGPHEHLLALTEAHLRLVTGPALEHLLRLPEVADALVDGLVETIRDRQESLGQFASVRHANRIRGKLMQLARVHGRVVAGGIRLDLPLTHELLGEMVGSARETVTWAVGELMRDGLVVREGRRYRLVVEPDALAS